MDIALYKRHVLLLLLLLIVAGICPFAGLILLDGYKHIGTFCEDGTFTLPVDQDLYLQYNQLVLIEYSLPSIGQISFTYSIHYSETSKKGLFNPCTYATEDLLQCPIENLRRLADPYSQHFFIGNEFLYEYFQYIHRYSETHNNCSIDLTSLRLSSFQVVAQLLPVHKKCSQLTNYTSHNAFVQIDIPPNHKFIVKCGKTRVTPYLHQARSNFVYSANKRYVFGRIMVHFKGMCHSPQNRLGTIKIDGEGYNKIYPNNIQVFELYSACGMHNIERSGHHVFLLSHKPIECTQLNVHTAEDSCYDHLNIVLDSTHSPGTQLEMTLQLKDGDSNVNLTMMMKEQKTEIAVMQIKSLIIEIHVITSSLTNDVTLLFAVQQIPEDGKTSRFSNQYPFDCSLEDLLDFINYTAPVLFRCIISRGPIILEKSFVGIYNDSTHSLYKGNLYNQETIIAFGPVDVSADDANVLCASIGKSWKLLEFKSFVDIELFLMNLRNNDLKIFQVMFWVVHFDIRKYKSKTETKIFYRLNCARIQKLWFQKEGLFCSEDKQCRGYMNHFHLPAHIKILNEDIFCSNQGKYPDAEQKYAFRICPVFFSFDNCLWYIFLYFPCDFILPMSGYVCQQRIHIEKHATIPVSENEVGRIINDIEKVGTFPLIKSSNIRFECVDHRYILSHHVCDGVADCPDGGDETNCTDVCSSHINVPSAEYCFLSCQKFNCSCSPLYFQCTTGGCVPRAKICDCYDDCADKSDESPSLCSYTTCQYFKAQNLSLYEEITTNSLGLILPPYTYCFVPGHDVIYNMIQYLCNGIDDCLSGQDEWGVDCENLAVVPSLYCPRDRAFVVMDNIDDSVAQCPMSYEDELVSYIDRKLPSFCKASGLAVQCVQATSSFSLSILTKSLTLISVGANVDITQFWQKAAYLLILQIQLSNMTHILNDTFCQIKSITALVIVNSYVKSIDSHAFQSLTFLSLLNLHGNSFRNFKPNTFQSQLNLLNLDASFTHLTHLSPSIFSHNYHLEILNLSHTLLSQVLPDMFNSLKLLKVLDLSRNPINLDGYKDIQGFDSLIKLET